jgi:two-component system sensor histidine kinase KdpD
VAQREAWRRGLQTAAALALTGAITLGFRALPGVNASTVGFAYLLAVLAAASVFGLPEALLASVAAAAQYNFFFLPPVGTFTIEDPRNWIALATFLITAVVASELSASARRQARAAEQRQREIAQLYELSRATLLAPPDDPAVAIERALVAIFDFEDVWLELPERGPAPPGRFHHRRPLRVGQDEFGTLHIARREGAPFDDPALAPETGDAIAGLVAIGLERARVLRERSRLVALRESEALKSALLDSVAHDLRTPLTSIKAAATALLDAESHPASEAARRELLEAINEESDYLNRVVQTVLDMARIEAGGLQLNAAPVALADVLESAIARARLAPRRFDLELAPELPLLRGDGPLLSQALAELLANAAAYSSPESAVRVSAQARADTVQIAIRDQGPGIAADRLPRIFDRFYRGPEARRTRPGGLGMGLAIARGIVQAHGGSLEAASAPGEGSCFLITLPLQQPALHPEKTHAGTSDGHTHPDH